MGAKESNGENVRGGFGDACGVQSVVGAFMDKGNVMKKAWGWDAIKWG